MGVDFTIPEVMKYIGQMGYNNLVLLELPNSTNFYNNYSFKCSVCKMTIEFQIESYINPTAKLDEFMYRVKMFGDLHLHKEKESNIIGFNLFANCIIKESQTNVEASLHSPSVNDPAGTPNVTLFCNKCKAYFTYPLNDGISLAAILPKAVEFAHQHWHVELKTGPVIKLFMITKKTIEDINAGEYEIKFKNNITGAASFPNPGKIIPIDEKNKKYDDYFKYTDFELMGEIQVHQSNNRNISVSQELLKYIYKLSNFNVDLQAKASIKGTQYRALCTSCQTDLSINYHELISTSRDNETWVNLKIFCEEHKHFITADIEPIGRRFKNI